MNGTSGQVDRSIPPGAIGYQAGQSAFGDVHAWFEGVALGAAAQPWRRGA